MFLAELMKRHRVAGAAFALIRSGELAHTGFCGVADPEEDRPVDASTHFEIASLTKTVFARCILKLEDRGLLRLDRPSGNIRTNRCRQTIPHSATSPHGMC